MKSEARILQQGVQILPVKGRHRQTQERIGGKENKGEKRHPDRGLNCQNAGLQRLRQSTTKDRGHSAKQGNDQHPKQH